MITDPDLSRSAAMDGAIWKQSPYYEQAERWTHLFWSEGSVFRTLFDRLELASVVELACGHGRHAAQVVARCGLLTLVDMHVENVEFCRHRLAVSHNVDYVVNNGFDLRPLPDAGTTALFCYDAMVHFAPDVVGAYLFETARVLKPGGQALFHHSNFAGAPAWSADMNPHARNFMTRNLFAILARGAGLTVSESVVIRWGNAPNLDCITLLRRQTC